jgi:hypothetical protein
VFIIFIWFELSRAFLLWHNSLDAAIARNPGGIVVIVDPGASTGRSVVIVVVKAFVVSGAVLLSVAARVHASCVGGHEIIALDRCSGVLTLVGYPDFVVVVGESSAPACGIRFIRLLEEPIIIAFD